METGNVCFEYFILLKKNPATLERMKFEKEILAKTRLLAWHFWQGAANRHHIITKSHGKDVEFYCWHPEMNRQRIQMFFYDFESLY